MLIPTLKGLFEDALLQGKGIWGTCKANQLAILRILSLSSCIWKLCKGIICPRNGTRPARISEGKGLYKSTTALNNYLSFRRMTSTCLDVAAHLQYLGNMMHGNWDGQYLAISFLIVCILLHSSCSFILRKPTWSQEPSFLPNMVSTQPKPQNS